MQEAGYSLEEVFAYCKRPVVTHLGVLLCGLLIGILGQKILTLEQPVTEFHEVRDAGNYRFISPLVECENVDSSYSENISELESSIVDQISELEKQEGVTDIAYYFRDLNNGPWIAVDPDADFSPASLLKVPLAMSIYKIAEEHPTVLSERISNPTPDSATEQNIVPELQLAQGKEYTVSELIEAMLVYSNNRAYKLLLGKFSNEHPQLLSQVYQDLGITAPLVNGGDGGDIISVREYASFFRVLYNATYLEKKYSEQMLQTLLESTFTQGIVSGLPTGVGTAHKFGERRYLDTNEVQLHDCGIVYAERPYLLCIMTRGSDTTALSKVIRDLTHQTQQAFSQ